MGDLYALVMEWTLRELRFFVVAADAGSFTAAADELHVSQAAVSRTVAHLERMLGTQLLRRIARGCAPTPAGQQLLPEARRVLAEAQRFTEFARSRHATLRLGYAWAALGKHSAAFQKRWAREHEAVELELIRHNSATSGLAEGRCDVAIVRSAIQDARIDSVVVGLEQRMAVFPSDDPQWFKRRRLSLAELAERPIVVDQVVGTTRADLWSAHAQPAHFIQTRGVDSWLDAIAAGRGVGISSEATTHHHGRPGLVYRPLKDGPPIAVRLAWWRDQPPRPLGDLISAVSACYT